ncbi:hypothetical protein RJ641_031042 [Dillenia turbinata]|uniref:Chalcone isomerase domain-containing protein n=1 Tax=Dillenia turbinata TaxID=194707 RepID=A0AAN8VTI4_9MAGN
MVSLRFPFLFSPPKKTLKPKTKPTTTTASTSRHFSTVTIAASAAAAAAAAAAAIAITHHHQQETTGQTQRFLQDALNLFYTNLGRNYTTPIWGSLSLTDNQTPVVESKAGVSFPSNLGNSQRLLGIGLRRKSIFGLKNIDVYAYGVYTEENEIKNTLKNISIPELLEADVCMTVRLQIIYGKLSIRSVRGAFEESVGNRLEKFGGPDNKELLQRGTGPDEAGRVDLLAGAGDEMKLRVLVDPSNKVLPIILDADGSALSGKFGQLKLKAAATAGIGEKLKGAPLAELATLGVVPPPAAFAGLLFNIR